MINLKPTQALTLDANAQKGFIRYFANLAEKPSTTIRFFDRGDYYSVHGPEDTELVAKLIFQSTAVIKTMAPGEVEELSYVALGRGNFEKLVRELLLVRNYRVEVYSNAKNARANEWTLEYKGSPGNLTQFEDILFSGGNGVVDIITGTGVIAINLKHEGNQKMLGVACVESNDFLISVTEFVDDEFFSELEATTVLLAPKECLLPGTDGEFERIKGVMERNGVMVTIRKRQDFIIEKSSLLQDLNCILHFEKGQQQDANTIPELAHTVAMGALCAIVGYLNLTSDLANKGSFSLKQLNLNRFVHLDAAAVAALNIFPKAGTPMNSASYRWQSILGVLDRCCTPQGHRLMAQWVKQPLRDAALLRDRHDIVQCLVDSPSVVNELHTDYMKRIPDLIQLMKKLMRKKASLQDIFRVYQVLIRTPRLISTLSDLQNSAVSNVVCTPLIDTLDDLKLLKQMVEQVVDLNGIQDGEFFVKASFDEELKELREKMAILQRKMDKQLNQAADDLNLDKSSSVKLEHISHLGYHFRISLKDDACLRKRKDYKIIDAVKGGVRFTTNKLSDYSQQFTDTKAAYEEQQQTIVDEVVRVAVGYLNPLTRLNHQLAELDCLISFANAATSAPIPYVRPKILPEGSGVLKLKQIRHPCLELQENVTYISNDAFFEKDKTNMYIITGPNMGGKSTYIRSVGTAVLMAHVGAFVPCEEATVSMVDAILGRIGAGDNITKGLSTFMVEMIESSVIIRTATEKSLVIIDELGRGTSTYDGCGIAWSISEYLAKETKCFTLFATHFHEITELAEYVPTVKNVHIAAVADNKNFTLLYQVRPGVMDKSFGINVARLANFPEHVIQMAEKMYEVYDDKNESLKTKDDQKVMAELEAAIVEFCKTNPEDEDVDRFKDELRAKVRQTESSYFRSVFPAAFV